MRVLALLPRFPFPPVRGDTLRSWPLVAGLAQRHELWLACLDTTAPPAAHLAAVQARCARVAVFPAAEWRRLARGAAALLRGRSFTAGYFGDRRLGRLLADWSQHVPFDALLTYSSALGPWAETVPAPRRVLDLCDVDSAKWALYARRSPPPLGWLYALEARRVARLELRARRAHTACVVVNERERAKLAALAPHAALDVIPTPAALDEYATIARPGSPPTEPVIGFVGSLFYPPNVRAVEWFGRHVWPRVRAHLPRAQWWIIGARPARTVRRWAALPGVRVTGFVPDLRPLLAQLRVFIDPVDGEIGLQSKLVGALAAGRPAVVTPDAAAGLLYTGESPCLVAGGAEAFATAVLRLARDDALWLQLSRRARRLAETAYSPARQVAAIERWLTNGPVQPAHSPSPERAQRADHATAGRPTTTACRTGAGVLDALSLELP